MATAPNAVEWKARASKFFLVVVVCVICAALATPSVNVPKARNVATLPRAEDSVSDLPANATLRPGNHTRDDFRLLAPIAIDTCGKTRIFSASCVEEADIVHQWVLQASATNVDRLRRRWTFVDVGGNKGFVAAGVLEALGLAKLDPSKDFSRAAIRGAVFRQGKIESPGCGAMFCGSCCDCASPRITLPHGIQADKAEVFIYEAQRANSKFLHEAFLGTEAQSVDTTADGQRQSLRASAAHHEGRLNIHVTRAAVSDSTKTVKFVVASFGSEVGKVVASGELAGATVSLPAVSLDTDLPPRVTYIDILVSDTEGADYQVFEGAKRRFLSRGNVGLYLFEVWGRDQVLQSVVSRLESWGYRCFMPMSHAEPRTKWQEVQTPKWAPGESPVLRAFWPLNSTQCWQRHWNRPTWGNVACVNLREESLLAVFSKLTQPVASREALLAGCPADKFGFLSAQLGEEDATWIAMCKKRQKKV